MNETAEKREGHRALTHTRARDAMDDTGDGAMQALERACELHDAVGLAIDNLHRVMASATGGGGGAGGGGALPRRMSADLETLRLLKCVTSFQHRPAWLWSGPPARDEAPPPRGAARNRRRCRSKKTLPRERR